MPVATLLVILQAEGGGYSETLAGNPVVALGVLFGAGILTSLNPCIYPMIPITASILSGTAKAGGGRGRTVGLTLTYALGLASVYATLGLLAGLSGTLFGTVSANPWVMLAVGNLLLLFALSLLEVFPVPVPRRLMEWAGKQGGGSYGAIFLMGAGSGVVAAPCGAPAFAAVLTWVAATQAGVTGFFYLLAFSFGMTATLIGIGLSAGFAAALPRSGGWMVWVRRISALILIGMAQYYFVKAGYGM